MATRKRPTPPADLPQNEMSDKTAAAAPTPSVVSSAPSAAPRRRASASKAAGPAASRGTAMPRGEPTPGARSPQAVESGPEGRTPKPVESAPEGRTSKAVESAPEGRTSKAVESARRGRSTPGAKLAPPEGQEEPASPARRANPFRGYRVIWEDGCEAEVRSTVGCFYPYDAETVAFYCRDMDVARRIRRRWAEAVHIFAQGDEEATLHLPAKLYPEVAALAGVDRRAA